MHLLGFYDKTAMIKKQHLIKHPARSTLHLNKFDQKSIQLNCNSTFLNFLKKMATPFSWNQKIDFLPKLKFLQNPIICPSRVITAIAKLLCLNRIISVLKNIKNCQNFSKLLCNQKTLLRYTSRFHFLKLNKELIVDTNPSINLGESVANSASPRFIKSKDSGLFVPDRSTKYNPGLRPTLMEKVFDYDRQTFRNWESDKNTEGKGPILRPTLDKSSKAPRRLYTVEDVLNVYSYIEKQGEVVPKLDQPMTIAVWNNKGGVGKTTLVQHLASTMSILMGLKVLVVDTDSQSDCTYIFDCTQQITEVKESYDVQPTLRHYFGFLDVDPETGEETEFQADLDDTLVNLSPTLSVIPSDSDVSELDYDFSFLEGILKDDQNRDVSKIANIQSRFLDKIHDLDTYDVILFDCAPNKGALNLNILYGVDRLLIPIEIEAKCLYSLKNVLKFLQKMKTYHENFSFEKILGVPNKYHSVQNIKKEGLSKLQEIFGGSILSKSVIPLTTVLDQAANNKEPIFLAAGDTIKSRATPLAKRVANEFWSLAHEILDLETDKVLFPEVSFDENVL